MRGITRISIIMTTTANHTLCTKTIAFAMTSAATVLAQQHNRLHSHRLYMEVLQYIIRMNYLSGCCIVYSRSQADTAAEAEGLGVISKEAVGNSWGILSAILGHKCHQYDPDRNLQPKSESDHINFVLSVYVCAIDV